MYPYSALHHMTINGIDFGPLVTVLPENGSFTVTEMPSKRDRKALWKRSRVAMRGGGVFVERGQTPQRTLSDFLSSAFFRSGTEAFFIAVAVYGETQGERLASVRETAALVSAARPSRTVAGFGILLDLSALSSLPLGLDTEEVRELLQLLSPLGIPVAVRLSVIMSPELASDILDDDACDALFIYPGVPWSSLSDEAKHVFFRRKRSPFGGAGGMVFGKYVIPLAAEWVRQMRRQGIRKPVVVGGVMGPGEIDALREAGVTAVSKDSVARVLRPWNAFRIASKVRRTFS